MHSLSNFAYIISLKLFEHLGELSCCSNAGCAKGKEILLVTALAAIVDCACSLVNFEDFLVAVFSVLVSCTYLRPLLQALKLLLAFHSCLLLFAYFFLFFM